MKKILAALLAVAMLMSVGAAALAEDDQVTVTVPATQELNPVLKENAPKLSTTGDIVTVSGNHYTIITEGLKMDLDLDPSLGMYCFTQDIVASFDAYWDLSNDPEGLCNDLIDAGIHILLLSMYTGNEYQIMLRGSDSISARIGDLSSVSETMRDLYIGKIVEALTGNGEYVTITTPSSVWFLLPEYQLAMTIAGGQYVTCFIGTHGNQVTQDDIEEAADLFSCLSISAAE